MLNNQLIEYKDNNVVLEGYAAWQSQYGEKRPAILIAHDWSGRNNFAQEKAERLAELGYVGFAIDMYGKGKLGQTKEEKSTLMQPLMENRSLIQQRMLAAVHAIKALSVVDPNQIGAIGFCFGGLCALDLARSGADIKGVVSFHGLLQAPDKLTTAPIKAKVLVLHGFDDPMATPDSALQFGKEMTLAQANWELNLYGNTMHAFTNPEANDHDFGTVYDKQADQRSWIAMQEFFAEVFGR